MCLDAGERVSGGVCGGLCVLSFEQHTQQLVRAATLIAIDEFSGVYTSLLSGPLFLFLSSIGR